jgi:hypothetical protein
MSMRSAFLTLAATVLLASPAAASPLSAAARQAEKQQVAQLITQLHQAKVLLETAIHDYDGHRAAAVHQVHSAIRALEEHHHKANANQTNPNKVNQANPQAANPGNGNITPQEQAASDKQLKQADVMILQTLAGMPSSSSSPHLVKAAQHLTEAHSELKTALNIK